MLGTRTQHVFFPLRRARRVSHQIGENLWAFCVQSSSVKMAVRCCDHTDIKIWWEFKWMIHVIHMIHVSLLSEGSDLSMASQYCDMTAIPRRWFRAQTIWSKGFLVYHIQSIQDFVHICFLCISGFKRWNLAFQAGASTVAACNPKVAHLCSFDLHVFFPRAELGRALHFHFARVTSSALHLDDSQDAGGLGERRRRHDVQRIHLLSCVCVCKKHIAHHCKLCFLFLVCFCFFKFIALSPMNTCAFRWIWQLEGRVWYWSTRHTQRCGNAEKWAFGFPTILSQSAKRRQFETSYSKFHLMLWNSVQHELGSWPLADVCQRPEKLKQFERTWNIWNTCTTSLRARDFWGTSTRRGVATCWRLERAFACLIRPSKSRCLKLKWIRLLCALKETQSLAAGRSYSS